MGMLNGAGSFAGLAQSESDRSRLRREFDFEPWGARNHRQ
jgi:hypothetical protein